MKKFQLSIDTNTSRDAIHFEEVMFLASLKSSLLSKVCDNIFLIEVILSDNEVEHNMDSVKAIVKVHTQTGEYAGYSSGPGWEAAFTRAFQHILQQLVLLSTGPLPTKPGKF